jgi:hypothetical protein
MDIQIEHQGGKYPSFNVALASKPGGQPFLVIKGCRIVDGPNGQFVSGPATKNANTGKYWNHTYFGDKFSEAVLEKALEGAEPAPRAPAPKSFKPASQDAFKARQLAPQDDDSGIPF